ncbi:uncharacterized protein LOC141641415 [Silene latifolia]|uniref:uncharacterized protein LOC141641415 n=1 Tax=Silene latifolia TaxID=37657 RepID=UPI003D77CBF1
MRKPELSGRMSKWSVHLSGYDIRYDPRTAIKSQALADFVSDFSPAIQNMADKEILTLKGNKEATNNETEYEALILGMQLALELGVGNLQVFSDSLLIVNHVNDEYLARDSKMISYLKVAKELKHKFRDCKLKKVPRDQNVEAGAQATLGKPSSQRNAAAVLSNTDGQPAGQSGDQSDDQADDWDWRTPYLDWLRHDKLPDDKKESAPRTPKSNGQAESSNKIIMDNLRKKLQELRGKWADELPLVLWYGCMAGEQNNTEMIRSLDTIDELRASAKIRLAAYKQSVAKSYNKNVKVRLLEVGDQVLREVFQNTKNRKAGKFAYKWEGPYQVEGVVVHGAYRLMTMDGQIIHKSWNILHLKRYHF